MVEWCERLQQMIEATKPLQPEAYLELKANLLIYLIALYTHLGKNEDVRQATEGFVKCAVAIREADRRDKLLVLFCNRQIVTCTDLFRYAEGEAYYEILQKYFESRNTCSENLLADFIELENQDVIPDTIITQYGKCTGSYIQLLTKQHRYARTASQKENVKTKAESIISHAFDHFTKAGDISFCHQNVCDLLAELGQYDEAMKHLCLAVPDGDAPADFASRARHVLKATGIGCIKEHFVFLHYVNMMHRALVKGDPHGAEMLECLTEKETLTSDMYTHLKGNPHPEGVILWHLAASLAHLPKYQALAKELFEASWRSMEDSGFIFRTIGLAVHADEIDAGLKGNLPGKQESWLKDANIFLRI